MGKNAPIITVDDDSDDLDLLKEILVELGVKNEIIQYESCVDALEYLTIGCAETFLIFCDMNLPRMDGMEFKKAIDQNKKLREMSIPFIFYSTAANQAVVNQAYCELNIQGYFIKESSYEAMKVRVKKVVDYWMDAVHPD